LVKPKHWKRFMRLGTWNVRSLYRSGSLTNEIARLEACMGRGKVCTGFVGKPEGKRRLGRTRHRYECNIKMDLQEVGWGTWTRLMWLRVGTGGGLY
jgi:hypothetical protein